MSQILMYSLTEKEVWYTAVRIEVLRNILNLTDVLLFPG